MPGSRRVCHLRLSVVMVITATVWLVSDGAWHDRKSQTGARQTGGVRTVSASQQHAQVCEISPSRSRQETPSERVRTELAQDLLVSSPPTWGPRVRVRCRAGRVGALGWERRSPKCSG